MSGNDTIKIGKAKGRPMLPGVGKRPFTGAKTDMLGEETVVSRQV